MIKIRVSCLGDSAPRTDGSPQQDPRAEHRWESGAKLPKAGDKMQITTAIVCYIATDHHKFHRPIVHCTESAYTVKKISSYDEGTCTNTPLLRQDPNLGENIN